MISKRKDGMKKDRKVDGNFLFPKHISTNISIQHLLVPRYFLYLELLYTRQETHTHRNHFILLMNRLQKILFENLTFWRLNLLKIGSFENWTFWKLDLLKIGPFENWTFWKLNLWKFEPFEIWTFWKLNLFRIPVNNSEDFNLWSKWIIKSHHVLIN